MLARKDIRLLAKERLRDAQVLLRGRRYAGAIYLCGYAVELALKWRICETLRWGGYPATNADFSEYRSFKTHDLDVLLHLSGVEKRIKTKLFTQWSAVAQWNPESRYNPIAKAKAADASLMITSAKVLLRAI